MNISISYYKTFIWSQNFCIVNYVYLNLIPLRYILVDIPCNDNINWGNKQLSQNSKFDIEIKRLRLTKLHTKVATSELGTIVLDTHNPNRLYDLYIHYGHI